MLHYYIIIFFSSILAEEFYYPFIFHFGQQLHLIENIIKISEWETLTGIASYLFNRVVFTFYLNLIDLCEVPLPEIGQIGAQIIGRCLFIKNHLISRYLCLLSNYVLLLRCLLLSDPFIHCSILSIHPIRASGDHFLRLRGSKWFWSRFGLALLTFVDHLERKSFFLPLQLIGLVLWLIGRHYLAFLIEHHFNNTIQHSYLRW